MQIRQQKMKNCLSPRLSSISSLPKIFKDVRRTKNYCTFTTDDLIRLNNRIKQTVEEIYLQSDNVITKLINDVRTKIRCLYDLTEIIANIDLIFSFAYQSSCCNYVRPFFSSNFTELINVRPVTHPIIDKISISIPNSLFLSRDLNFLMITGPNMSGKTTFLKQIATLQIMAQIGSFVPAEFAALKMCDKIFTRIALNDNIKMTDCTTVLEIRELSYILNNLTPNSLVLVDELGKDCITEESLAIYWSLCESFLLTNSYVIFTTHFQQLTKLSDQYLNVSNCHFPSELIENDKVLKYPHRLLPGPTKEQFYGIKLAETSGLSTEIVEYAKKELDESIFKYNFVSFLNDRMKIFSQNDSTNDYNKDIVELQSKYRLSSRLVNLIEKQTQNSNEMKMGKIFSNLDILSKIIDADLLKLLQEEFYKDKKERMASQLPNL
ncbi:mutS protein-like protein 1 [Sarcoptes scabiei]|uniref:MutS protein-like protein 1 n=1 Tax=Sarcoptes scabiei TaxID=52283 RepID=A0A131ZVN4_SARSC|nr:mutS protein-like protein 1 [Sarcoptes scabiei]